MVEVYAIRLVSEEVFLKQKEHLLSLLPLSCQEIINRFKRVQGAQRSLLGELISRKVLSNKLSIPTNKIIFKKTDIGKPFITVRNNHFNLSHSGDWVVFAFAKKEVGIDIEKIKKINYRIAERFFSTEEFLSLNEKSGKEKQEYFFDLWTMKESYLKLIGTGLTRSLDSFTIFHKNNRYNLKESSSNSIEPIYIRQYNIDENYKLSVCSYIDSFVEEVEIFTLNNLTTL
ncbi:MAG: 4'-phosphopantetheinyl transferase superfamily protein [Bacteroidales bacterium]|nr:4'-phosphopantetheinyl transferase superfamily protein [Bacteroidales bacterium]